MFKLSFYVPEESLEAVTTAVFKAGAGGIGNYEHCCWRTRGVGQFRPLKGSDATIGELDQLTRLEEWKVEMVCKDAQIKAIIAALKVAHPYEEVAYDVLQMIDVNGL